MFKKLSALVVFALASIIYAQTTQTDIIATDWDGKVWDFDSLLASGKHIWVHQMSTG